MTDHFAVSFPAPDRRLSILVVDDSRLQRRVIAASLAPLGCEIRETGSGSDALEMCREDLPDIVISELTGKDLHGLDLCAEIRRLSGQSYVYFIILTSKLDDVALGAALRDGADDFLSKPLSAEEMRGRIAAGERLLNMARELQEKNRLVTSTLQSMREMHERLDRDLDDARRLQMSLVPGEPLMLGAWRISFMLRSSGHVGGDLVGHFPVSDGRVGLFSLDVSGHGVAPALVTARLSSWLSGAESGRNMALGWRDGSVYLNDLAETCVRVNDRFLTDLQSEHYFTMVLGDLDTTCGEFRFVQAGHPYPALISRDGSCRFVGTGGPPLGLLPDLAFETSRVPIAPGERLLICSDGLTECPDAGGQLLSEEGLARLVARHSVLEGHAFLDALAQEMGDRIEDVEMADDLSAVLIEHVAD